MGLSEYHEKVIPVQNHLGTQDFAYHRACDVLHRKNPDLLPESEPGIFLMGGCHPYIGGAHAFRKLFSHIHPHPQNKFLGLDIVPKAISKINPSVIPFRFAADLQEIPLRPESVDIIVLDHVLPFMSDRQVENMSEQLGSCLKHEGLLMTTTVREPLPLLGWLTKIRASREHHTEIFPRHGKDYARLLPNLKPILEADAKEFYLRVFSKAGNVAFEQFRGEPYNYELDHLSEIDIHYAGFHEFIAFQSRKLTGNYYDIFSAELLPESSPVHTLTTA